MASNMEEYKKELSKLVECGRKLLFAMQNECHPDEFREHLYERFEKEEKVDDFIKRLPDFKASYQSWYTKSKSVIKQVIPDRLNDFISYYEPQKGRKTVEYGNYVVYDYLQDLAVTLGTGQEKVNPSAAIPQFRQQFNILKSAEERFESKLFDIKQLTQADVFDTEIDSAKELKKHNFLRSSGMIAGVVLEKHLAQVCENHKITLKKKKPSLSDYIQKLKENEIIDTPRMRRLQSMADIRNICGHGKDRDPTFDEIDDIISGVEHTIKNIF